MVGCWVERQNIRNPESIWGQGGGSVGEGSCKNRLSSDLHVCNGMHMLTGIYKHMYKYFLKQNTESILFWGFTFHQWVGRRAISCQNQLRQHKVQFILSWVSQSLPLVLMMMCLSITSPNLRLTLSLLPFRGIGLHSELSIALVKMIQNCMTLLLCNELQSIL